MTIPSPYQINEMLLSALPEDQRRQVQGRVMRARRYEPADRRSFQADPEEFQLSVGFAQAAETRVVESFTRRSMAMTVAEPSIGTYVVGLRTRGSVAISDRSSSNERMWNADSGIIYRERQDTRVVISDAHVGTSFELPNDRTNAILAAMIERPVTVPIEFTQAFSLTTDTGSHIARAIAFVRQELAVQGSMPFRNSGGAALEDLLIRTLLTTPFHSYSNLLERRPASAAPFNVKRAEAFMRAHAHEALSIEQSAAAAGCGVRSLQSAFRQFNDCTPMARLRRIRLEQAHQEMQSDRPLRSITEIATKFQFSNAGRFASEYRSLFGRLPSQARLGPLISGAGDAGVQFKIDDATGG